MSLKIALAHPDNTRLKGDRRRTTFLLAIYPSLLVTLTPGYFWYLSLHPRRPRPGPHRLRRRHVARFRLRSRGAGAFRADEGPARQGQRRGPRLHREGVPRPLVASSPRPGTSATSSGRTTTSPATSRRRSTVPEARRMRIGSDTRGVYAIAPTPFHAGRRASTAASIDRMIDFYVAAGVDRLTMLGHHGRGAEARRTTRRCAVAPQRDQRAPRLPVVVGVSAPGFAAMRGAGPRASMDVGRGRRDDRAARRLRTDDADRRLLRAGRRGDRRRRAVRAPGLSADLLGADDARR